MQPDHILQVLFTDRITAVKSTRIRAIRGIDSKEALGGQIGG
jgi:hypothetical protein